MYQKQREDEKAAQKKRKLADEIAGEGTTTVAQSRTEHISYGEQEDRETAMRPPSELQT